MVERCHLAAVEKAERAPGNQVWEVGRIGKIDLDVDIARPGTDQCGYARVIIGTEVIKPGAYNRRATGGNARRIVATGHRRDVSAQGNRAAHETGPCQVATELVGVDVEEIGGRAGLHVIETECGVEPCGVGEHLFIKTSHGRERLQRELDGATAKTDRAEIGLVEQLCRSSGSKEAASGVAIDGQCIAWRPVEQVDRDEPAREGTVRVEQNGCRCGIGQRRQCKRGRYERFGQ